MIAVDWMEGCQGDEERVPSLRNALMPWFRNAPPMPLLRIISEHILTFNLERNLKSTSNHFFLPVSVDLVIEISADYFGPPSSKGTSMALHGLLQRAGPTDFEDIDMDMDSKEMDELAIAISHLTEFADFVKSESASRMKTSSFVPWFIQNLADFVQLGLEKQKQSRLSIAGSILSKLTRRGMGKSIARDIVSKIWKHLEAIEAKDENDSSVTPAAILIRNIHDSFSFERMLDLILMEITSSEYIKKYEENENFEIDSVWLQIYPSALWNCRSDLRSIVGDKFLTLRLLPRTSLDLIIRYLNIISSEQGEFEGNISCISEQFIAEDALAAAAGTVAKSWGNAKYIERASPSQQASMTYFLSNALKTLGRLRLEKHQDLLGNLISGISTRLASPMSTVRVQGMRVGKAMSAAINSNNILFSEEDLALADEEEWEVPVIRKKQSIKRNKKYKLRTELELNGRNKENNHDDYPETETDSDDDLNARIKTSDFLPNIPIAETSSDSEFESYDIDESDDDSPEKLNLQLKDLLRMLQDVEKNPKDQIKALRSAETLIRAEPDELPLYMGPLSRALLYSKIPSWADENRSVEDYTTDSCRFRSLVSLTAALPEPVGLGLIEEFFSPSNDVLGRARALAVLSSAASEIASPGSYLNSISKLQTASMKDTGAETSEPQNIGDKFSGVVRWRAEHSLSRHSSSKEYNSSSQRNLFPPVAIKWAAALLRDADIQMHGIDLLGRDHFLLGKLLLTLGSFLEFSRHSLEAIPLSAAVLQIIKSPKVHDSDEPYVRRTVLMTSAQVLMALPSAAVSSAILDKKTDGGVQSKGGQLSIYSEEVSNGLTWILKWFDKTIKSDSDGSCRELAAACKGLHDALTSEALTYAVRDMSLEADIRTKEFFLPLSKPSLITNVPIDISLPNKDSFGFSTRP